MIVSDVISENMLIEIKNESNRNIIRQIKIKMIDPEVNVFESQNEDY